VWKVVGVLTRGHVAAFQASGGRVGGRFGKVRILLLHHVGRKSGRKRITPLIYLDDGDRLAIVASKGGVDKHPAWFHNLMATPETTVELPGEKRRVRARTADDAERAELWPRLVEVYGPYEDYQKATKRRIPVVVLDRA
jgi:deazaflavin-dependent oxidoreductase (nitroreductase family)